MSFACRVLGHGGTSPVTSAGSNQTPSPPPFFVDVALVPAFWLTSILLLPFLFVFANVALVSGPVFFFF